ncbi:hypothetical protein Cgig2_009297 [Carnegiea gigantea]|uniref:Uncharacterized protein n=1 Tax=Carnegiea gigantea TaxID=171969 RepID=A0A9Q1JWU9_9CARY|nr:hypothetical protein Cgig2_009297 [Carnegiea gigantea]
MNTRASPLIVKASPLIVKASPSAHEQPEVSIQEESNGIVSNQSHIQDENISSPILTSFDPPQLTSSYASMVDPNEGDVPEFIEFINEVNLVVRQPVKYEWKPTKCEHCQMFGHTLHNCRKRNKTRMVWREVAKGNATNSDAAHHQPFSLDHQEDFIKIPEKHIVKSSRRASPYTYNHFQTLIKQEVSVLST